MIVYKLYKTKLHKKKKFMVVRMGDRKKTIRFGDRRYHDYISLNKELPQEEAFKHKVSYIKRHHKEDWTDLDMAGTWSRYILWGQTKLKTSIADMEKKFGIKIHYVK